MEQGNKKRKHAQYEEDNILPQDIGLGATLAALKAPAEFLIEPSQPDCSPNGEATSQGFDGNGWTKVTKSAKRRKNKEAREQHHADQERRVDQQTQTKTNGKKKQNYPAVTYAAPHTMLSSLKLSDLQNLLLYCIADGTAPQWLSVRHHHHIKKAVVLFVPGLEKGMFDSSTKLTESISDTNDHGQAIRPEDMGNGSTTVDNDFHVAIRKLSAESAKRMKSGIAPDEFLPIRLSVDKLPSSLQPLAELFEHAWPVKAAGDDKNSRVYSPLHHMLNSPLPKSREEKEVEKNMKGARPAQGKYWENKPTPITAFISSKEDLLDNDYVLHPAAFDTAESKEKELARRKTAKQAAEDGWVDTKLDDPGIASPPNAPEGDLTAGRTVLAMDCEMCIVEGGESALTRISLVGWDGSVIMDELVKPEKVITDYLTPYSGITALALAPITTTLTAIQSRLLTLLSPSTILIGHSLNSDLAACQLTHSDIIDTSLLYPHPRGPPLKSSLKWLAQKYLSREIQRGHGATGHDSVEDARACLDLVKKKCEKGPRWGSVDADRESIFKRLSRVAVAGREGGKRGAIVDHGTVEKNFGQMASCCIGCESDKDIVEGVRRAVLGDEDGAVIPGAGVELAWARLNNLSTARGWITPSLSTLPLSSLYEPLPSPSPSAFASSLTSTIQHIKAIHDFLPPCTLLMVYSGTGDPRPLARLQELQRRYRDEYKTKKWDELSVKWTDVEEQAMKEACRVARGGVGFVGVK